MKAFVLIAVFLLTFAYGSAQNKIVLPETMAAIDVDDFGNIYLWNNDKLEVYSDQLKKIRETNLQSIFGISKLDAKLNQKLLLYSESSNKVLFLDRHFAQLSIIDLNYAGFTSVSTVCASKNKGFWLLDAFLDKLFFMDHTMQVLYRSTELGLSEEFFQAREIQDQVILSNGKNKVWAFDLFANYLNEYELMSSQKLFLSKEGIFYVSKEGFLFQFNLSDFSRKRILEGISQDIIYLTVEQGKVYILKNNQLIVYNLVSN